MNNRTDKTGGVEGMILRGRRKLRAAFCGVLTVAICMSGMSGFGGVTAEAAEKAGLNLFSRYGIQLQSPMIENEEVIVEVKMPEEQAEGFSCGNRLRGLSAYLMKYCGGRYDRYQVGNRLLTYMELTEKRLPSKEIASADKFRVISRLAQLMERTDAEAVDKVRRVMEILEEGRDEQ